MNQLRVFVLILALFVSGCCTCDPTVKALQSTIRDMRVDDYESGRVVFTENEPLNKRLLEAKIERMKMAENNAATFLKEPLPHPDLMQVEKESDE